MHVNIFGVFDPNPVSVDCANHIILSFFFTFYQRQATDLGSLNECSNRESGMTSMTSTFPGSKLRNSYPNNPDKSIMEGLKMQAEQILCFL